MENIDAAVAQIQKRCRHCIPPPEHLACSDLHQQLYSTSENTRDQSSPKSSSFNKERSEATCLGRVEHLGRWKQRIDDGCRRGGALMSNIQSVDEKLELLAGITATVREESEQLSSGASALMLHKSRLERVFEGTKNTLTKFQKVDELSNEVSNPLLSATSARFSAMVDEIDELTDYLNRCKAYKSAGLFAGKAALAQQRASLCLREAIISDLNVATGDIIASSTYSQLFKDPSKVPFHGVAQSSNTESGTAGPTDFCSALAKVSNSWISSMEKASGLRRMLEARANGTDDSDASEVLSSYRECRIRMLAPLVDDQVQAAFDATEPRDLRSYSNIALTHFSELATVESELYHSVWLREDFCDEPFMKLLVELGDSIYSSFRSSLLVLDDVEQLSFVCSSLVERQDEHEAVKRLAKRMAEDAQERLIFRTSIFIRNKIEKAVPTISELESLATAESAGEIDAFSQCVFLLELLYNAVDKHVFGVFAEDCVHNMISILQRAERLGKMITASPPLIHGELLTLRHLLLLRSQVGKYDSPLASVEKSIDVSQLAQRKLAIIQSSREAKRDIESILKTSCEQTIQVSHTYVAEPILSASSQELLAAALQSAQERYETLDSLMHRYLTTGSTITVLMKPIRTSLEKSLTEKKTSLQIDNSDIVLGF